MKESSELNLSLPQIATEVNLSVSHFSSIFKQVTGVSPISYYNNIKIQKACEYLKYSDTLVKEISYKLGLFDVQYFSRLFVKTMGISPLKYRLQHKSL
ncbi:MAG TPA: helix-turn-helix transcriptional regulator [Pelobium sp.]|nr:helix-turn-helix transcriptional regulator [Pelobium sp.]